MRELGETLLELARQATTELLLVAPYIKAATLSRVLEACPVDASVKVVTRWRIDEIAAGVSDLDVWPMLRERGAGLWLHPHLHAKYYRAGAHILLGSANLTNAALGWRQDPNLELLLAPGDKDEAPAEFERVLWSVTRPVDETLYAAFVRALEVFPRQLSYTCAPEFSVAFADWRPQLRFPEDLSKAYLGQIEFLTPAARGAATADLSALAPPPGLTSRQFEAWIGLQLRQHPEMQAIDRFLSRPRRFGEVRDLLVQRGATNGDRSWQSWMRWLLHFLPESYDMQVANYSEIFRKRQDPVDAHRYS